MLKRVAIFAIPTALAKGVQFGSSALEFPNTGNDEFGDGIESVRTQVGVLWKDGSAPNDASPDFFVPRKLGVCGSTANKVNKGEQSPLLNEGEQSQQRSTKAQLDALKRIQKDQLCLDALKHYEEGPTYKLPQDATLENLLVRGTENLLVLERTFVKEMKNITIQNSVWKSRKAEAEKKLKKLKEDSSILRESMEGRNEIEKKAMSEALAKNQQRQRREKDEVSYYSSTAKRVEQAAAEIKFSYERKKGKIEETKEWLQSISRLEKRIHSERAKVLGDISHFYTDEPQNKVGLLISHFMGADDRKLSHWYSLSVLE